MGVLQLMVGRCRLQQCCSLGVERSSLQEFCMLSVERHGVWEFCSLTVGDAAFGSSVTSVWRDTVYLHSVA